MTTRGFQKKIEKLEFQKANLEREFEKLMIMLQDKFPEAWKYYTDRLRPPKEEQNKGQINEVKE